MKVYDFYHYYVLRGLRKIYFMCNPNARYHTIEVDHAGAYHAECMRDILEISKMIASAIDSGSPLMVARFGNTELSAISNIYEIKHHVRTSLRDVIDYIQGKRLGWWKDLGWMNNMKIYSGFFPTTDENLERFYQLMIADMKEVDILASWIYYEKYFVKELKNAKRIALRFEQMYLCEHPWTQSLKGKRVLVVHPFEETILAQYERRKLIWENKETLPDFELITIKAVQSINGTDEFESWFEALEYMKRQIDSISFDICLLGCGAYGFPLAAYIKRQGKQAIHVGGALQLLFGIKGRRWDEMYQNVYNEYWVRPSKSETPQTAGNVEGGCYW